MYIYTIIRQYELCLRFNIRPIFSFDYFSNFCCINASMFIKLKFTTNIPLLLTSDLHYLVSTRIVNYAMILKLMELVGYMQRAVACLM